ncbi:hypothetical protein KFK09_017219 [Dendrobium nobile]|uniref:Uncharacterized protein n=1 Tax=Dendrobium nobile TaxID=94219 RepID=A0A8T3B2T9_DENNO|nr:hypothetical protein KFK09_017219 [Dendrobium nobile]
MVAGHSSRPRNPPDISTTGLDTRIRSKFCINASIKGDSRSVASRKTLLRTNGSHDRCTIDFARSILRGRQATLIRLRLQFLQTSCLLLRIVDERSIANMLNTFRRMILFEMASLPEPCIEYPYPMGMGGYGYAHSFVGRYGWCATLNRVTTMINFDMWLESLQLEKMAKNLKAIILWQTAFNKLGKWVGVTSEKLP